MSIAQQFIEYKAYQLRRESLIATSQAGSGHPTSCLSAADIVAVLFFHTMKFFADNPRHPDNDRFILSKGHASALLYAVWKELGYITEQELLTYRTAGSVLEGHPTPRFEPVLVATGSLGMGLANGVGMTLCAQRDKRDFYTYVLMGDSETAEGSVWEAAQLGAYYHLTNVVAIVDCNGLGQSTTPMYDHDTSSYAHIFQAFGWHTIEVDGHDVAALIDAFDRIRAIKNKPCALIAHTIKGYGLASIEGKQGFHGKAFPMAELPTVLKELATRFAHAASYTPPADWRPHAPTIHRVAEHLKKAESCTYKLGELVATRKAFGTALAAQNNSHLMTFDGEVKNSTYTQDVEKQHPQQFVECFIAEQAMVSIATGAFTCDKIPFVATFGSFLTRAHDQLRMAAIGRAALRVAGSHAGVSIGQDGPSQMALEDIAMMSTLPESVILYPADAVSTHHLVEQMIAHQDGISYLRLTRETTPVIYKNDESFPIGGCKVVRRSNADKACVIGAGITLFEALKAHEILAQENIAISVIDLYSVKPLDTQTLVDVVRTSGNKAVTVEDHYAPGGIGNLIANKLYPRLPDLHLVQLAITTIPASGSATEQRAAHGIDAHGIVNALRTMLRGRTS